MKKIEPKDIDDDLFCYYDETGELPTDWEQVTFFDEETDLAVVSVDGIYGAVNRNGETIIPIIYDYAMIRFSEGLLAVKKGNKWGYVDENHNIVIPFEYDNLQTYGSAIGAEDMFNGSFRGVADYFSDGKIFVRKNDKIGVIDKKNKIIFPFIYKDISSCNKEYLCVSHDKLKYGVVNYNNKTILPFEYDYLFTNENFLNFSEKSEINSSNIDTSFLYKVKDGKLLKHGIIDFKGKIVVPAISSIEINNFIDGKAMCFDYKKQEFFVFDTKTNEIMYAPENLQENGKDNAKVNFIRNVIGMEPISF